MSTTSSADNPNLQTTSSPTSVHTSESFEYTVIHVFLPFQPNKNEYSLEKDHSLARAVCAAAHAYGTRVCGTSEQAQWHHITKMLDNLQAFAQSECMDNVHVISQLRGMHTGGTFAGSPHTTGRSDNVQISSQFSSGVKMSRLSSRSRSTVRCARRSRCPQTEMLY
jgi:hypothetical protein